MTLESWLMIAAALVANVLSAYFLLKDFGINKIKDDGFLVVSRKIMLVYSAVAIAVNIGISLLFALYYKDNGVLFSLKRLFMLAVLWPVGLIDLKTYRIPNKFILFGLCLRAFVLVFELLFARTGILYVLLSEIIAALALGLASFLCSICLKNSIGFGDIKLFIVMGLMLGLLGIWSAIFVSLVIAFVVSIVLLISRKKGKKDVVPFAPSIMLGTYISIVLTGM